MTPSPTVAIAAGGVLLLATGIDLKSRTIPDALPLLLTGLALVATWRGWHAVTWAQLGIGLGVSFAIGAALFYAGAMGGGDAKLCAGLGAVCGWPHILEVLFATALAGGVLALWARRRGQESLPFAPAFASGYLATLGIAWSMPPTTGLWHLITGRPV
ncbi:MAG: A24 family peptidase [Planctomycetota bacterium]